MHFRILKRYQRSIATGLILSIDLCSIAQPYLPRAIITRVGNEVFVFANDPRPLNQALSAISEEFGWLIDYEDPIYTVRESVDATDLKWRKVHPKESGIFIPSGTTFEGDLGKIDAIKLHEFDVIERLVMNYNQTNNPGYFRVIHTVGSAFVISGQTRQGNEAQRKVILDTVIQPRSEKQLASMMLQNLVFQCGSKSGVTIELGLTPLNMLNQVTINGYTRSVSCRTELTEILSKLPSAFTYQLLYDISSHSYVLNVLPAHQVVVGPDGKTKLVPLKQKTVSSTN